MKVRYLLGLALCFSSSTAMATDWKAYEAKWKPITCQTYRTIEMGADEAAVMDQLNEVYPPSDFLIEHEEKEMGAKKITIKDKQKPQSFMFIVGFDQDKQLNFKNIGYYCAN